MGSCDVWIDSVWIMILLCESVGVCGVFSERVVFERVADLY